MKILIALISSVFILSTSLYSQTLLPISSTEDTNKTPKYKPFAIKLKVSKGSGNIGGLFGYAVEFQYKPAHKNVGNVNIAWLINLNPLFVYENDQETDRILTFLTAGPKFYISRLSNKNLVTYISLCAGSWFIFHKQRTTKANFAFTGGLGIEYGDETFNFNADIKPNINIIKNLEEPLINLLINAGFGVNF